MSNQQLDLDKKFEELNDKFLELDKQLLQQLKECIGYCKKQSIGKDDCMDIYLSTILGKFYEKEIIVNSIKNNENVKNLFNKLWEEISYEYIDR